MFTRYFRWQDLHVAVDVGPQVLHLEMDPYASWDEWRQWAKRSQSEDESPFVEFDPDERFPSLLYLPTDSASLRLFRQIIAQPTSSRTDSASLRL